MSRLSLRLAAAFLAFVIAGSLAIVFWMALEERRQSREQFAELARTTAELFKSQNYPLSPRTADPMSEALGVDLIFVKAEQGGVADPPWSEHLKPINMACFHSIQKPGVILDQYLNYPGIRGMISDIAPGRSLKSDGQKWEIVSWPLREGNHLALLRPTQEIWYQLPSLRTVGILFAFWLLSFGLAVVLARGIVGPLRSLAKRLPQIGEDGEESIPEAARKDEIGELARAYQSTRKQLAYERRAREQAERLATLGRMATGLAHEINNPVSAIKLHAQLLEGDAPSESIATILGENAKIEALVNQWMFLARPQPPAVAPCDLAELVAECIRTVSPAAAHANVTIHSKVAQVSAEVDRRRVAQAVCNVLMNAIHAMADGGELSVSSASEAGNVMLVFRDTGPGFSAAALSKATELFYSEKEGGMGIGLSVTGEILRAHGGELRIANGERGAVVTLVFPRREKAEPTKL